MPSSSSGSGPDDPARFFRGAILGASVTIAALLALTVIVDPFGALSPAFGEARICPKGIKDTLYEEDSKLMLPIVRRPQVIMTGTSRIITGFDQHSLDRFTMQPAVNLGISGASLPDIVRLTQTATERAQVSLIVVGTDFSSFIRDPHASRVALADKDASDRWLLVRRGLLSPHAMMSATVNAFNCRSLSYSVDGARLPSARAAENESVARVAAGFVILRSELSRDPVSLQTRNLADNLAAFRSLVASASRRGTRFVILIGPYRSHYREAVMRAGRNGLFARWETGIRAIASSNSAVLIDGNSPQFRERAGLPPCTSGRGLDCYFKDALHYSPMIGDAIVPLAEGQKSSK